MRYRTLISKNGGIINYYTTYYYLGSQDKKQRTQEIQALLIIRLHDRNSPNRVGITPAEGNPAVGNHGDDDVLFHVKGTRVQAEGPAHEPDLLVGQGRGHEFADGQDGDLHQDGGYG